MPIALPSWFSEIAPVVTAVGVVVAAVSLVNTRRQARTTFEDKLAEEYRQITRDLPTAALLGEILTDDEITKHLPNFYQYFDLTNYQIFLRQRGRVSRKTWKFWVDGIKTNLERPSFAHSWDDVSRRSATDFSELRRLIRDDFKHDPKRWWV
jgi:hypothetical protein